MVAELSSVCDFLAGHLRCQALNVEILNGLQPGETHYADATIFSTTQLQGFSKIGIAHLVDAYDIWGLDVSTTLSLSSRIVYVIEDSLYESPVVRREEGDEWILIRIRSRLGDGGNDSVRQDNPSLVE